MARYRITTLSPLHIGGQEGQISQFEFVAHGGRTYVLNSQRLAEELRRRELLGTYVAQATGAGFSHGDFFRRCKMLDPKVLSAISDHSCVGSANPKRELRVFVRNGFARPYIPGSSLKGCIRTALLYAVLKRMPDTHKRHQLDQYVEGKLARLRPHDKRAAKSLRAGLYTDAEADLLQAFVLRDRERTSRGPHTDIMRCVQVSDSQPIERDTLAIMEIKLYSADGRNKGGRQAKSWSFYAECALPKTTFDLEITFDERTWREFVNGRWNKNITVDPDELRAMLADPLGVTTEFAADVVEHERSFFEKQFGLGTLFKFHGKTPNIHLGWGGGMIASGIALLLPEGLRRRMQDALFPHQRPGAPSPKSRRVVVHRGEPTAPLGWAVIERIG